MLKSFESTPVPLVLAASAWIALPANAPLWRELHQLGLLAGAGGWLLGFALAGVLIAGISGILSLLAWRWTLKPATCLLLVVAAAAAYFMWTYRIVVNSDMVVNVLQTDRREAAALMSPPFFAVLVILGGVPCMLVLRIRLRLRRWPLQAARNGLAVGLALLVIAGLILVAYQPLSSAMRNHKNLRYLLNPLNTVYALGRVAASSPRQAGPPAPVGVDAVVPRAADRPPLLLLVVGETARASNFGINGYERPTTPGLQEREAISFTDVTACGTSTAASLPCMFSHLGRSGFEARNRDHENLLDVLQRAGLAVLWLDNQSGCKGVCDRVPSQNVARNLPGICAAGECLDDALLAGLDDRMAALPLERRSRGVVLVMHQMGSHGPAYFRRSPPGAKRFTPECTSNNLPECEPSTLRNAYDNSIAYTDSVLSSSIDWLKKREGEFLPALVYVSDHGESLGEKNLYLHGLPWAIAPDVQKKVPWITWTSMSFSSSTGLDLGCLRRRAPLPMSHDNYFHSVLGLLQVRTSVYSYAMDAYAPCRRQLGRAAMAYPPGGRSVR